MPESSVVQTNGKFLQKLLMYGGWVIGIAAVGWQISQFIGTKANADDLIAIQARLGKAEIANSVQDEQIKMVREGIQRIENKLDKALK